MRKTLPFLLMISLAVPATSSAQKFFKKLSDAAERGVNRTLDKKTNNAANSGAATSASSSNNSNTPAPKKDTIRITGSRRPATSAPVEKKLPEGLKQQPLLKLDDDEMIVASESDLAAGPGKAGNDYSFTYTIISKKGKQYYVTTNKGKQGPFDKLTKELLPASYFKRTPQFGNVTELPTPRVEDNTRFLKHIGMTADKEITVDKKVIRKLKTAEMLGQYAYDESNGKYFVVVTTFAPDMSTTQEVITNTGVKVADLVNNTINFVVSPITKEFYVTLQDKKTFVKTLIDEKGNELSYFKDHVYITADKKNYVSFEEGRDAGITLNKERKWKLQYGEATGKRFIFSDDGNRWVSISGHGLDFSDGTAAEGGIVPVVNKINNKTTLHFLLLNPEHEITACSMDW